MPVFVDYFAACRFELIEEIQKPNLLQGGDVPQKESSFLKTMT